MTTQVFRYMFSQGGEPVVRDGRPGVMLPVHP